MPNKQTILPLYDQLQQCALAAPNKVAVAFQQKTLTYSEFVTLVDTMAANLFDRLSVSSEHIAPAPVVAIHYRNTPEQVALLFAVAKLGWTVVMLNVSLRSAQLIDQIQTLAIDLVVTSPGGVTLLGKQLSVERLCALPGLLEPDERVDAIHRVVDIDSDFIVTMSSGSTASPKPIALSQRCKRLRSIQATQSYHVTPNDIILCASPLHHSLGQRLCLLPLLTGSTLVLLEHFTIDAWLQAVEQHRVSFTIAVSSHLQALRNRLLAQDHSLNSLRCLVTSSAQIDEPLKTQLTEGLGCEFHEMYGATEVATVSDIETTRRPDKLRSVGQVLPGVEVQILDADRQRLPSGQVGEIAVRSPFRFNGYFHHAGSTTQAFHDDFFLTGDLGFMDADNFLYFRSREKDIIISGGINIVPADIEAVLLQHERVDACVAVATADDYLGEVITVVCVPHGEVCEADITALKLHANAHLAGFQQPRNYVFVEAFPLTASGKIDRKALREQYGQPEAGGSASG